MQALSQSAVEEIYHRRADESREDIDREIREYQELLIRRLEQNPFLPKSPNQEREFEEVESKLKILHGALFEGRIKP